MENGRMARQKTSDGFLLQTKRDFQLASSRVELDLLETLWTTKLNLKKKKKKEKNMKVLLVLY